jgi:hybrid polyketide synthase/nonribosomal peptide synthetase ACE1
MVTETDYLFLIAGNQREDGGYVVALAENLISGVYLPPSWIITGGESEDQAVTLLLSLYVHFLARSLVNKMDPGMTLAVLEPDFSIAAALTYYAYKTGVQLVFLTTKDTHCSYPWVPIHRNSTRRELSNKIPRTISRLFIVGGNTEVEALLKELLPADCQFENEQDLTRDVSKISSPLNVNHLASQMQMMLTTITQGHVLVNLNRLPQLNLRDLIESQGFIFQSLISWGHSKLSVQVKPATKTVKFAKDKTYWLVGLTGGLGLSLCQWMAKRGARYIALSSRSPKVDQNWIQRMAANGCNVRVFAT